MAESTLALTLFDFKAEVGVFLGWGRGSESGNTDIEWDDRQSTTIASVVASGQRQFYHPPGVPGVAEPGYLWTFLRPRATLVLAEGESEIELPDDYGGVEGKVTISGDDQYRSAVPVTNEGRVRKLMAESPSLTGEPQLVAEVAAKGRSLTEGQRRKLVVYPAADAEYTLMLAYYILPERLTGAKPYHYGGAAHSETILESCLAVAEERLDDTRGVHAAKFLERLGTSIMLDRAHKPQTWGYNADRSDERGRVGRDTRHGAWGSDTVTFNGVEPD